MCVTPTMDAATVPFELALNGVDGSPSEVLFTFYPQPQLHALSMTGGPIEGGTVVTLHGSGFGAFGLVARPLSWSLDGGASASHRIVSRCRFGDTVVPVIDMSDVRAVCTTPALGDVLSVVGGNGSSVRVSLSLNR